MSSGNETETVTMYSPANFTGNSAFEIVAQCASLHGADIKNHVGAEFTIEVPDQQSTVMSFVAWLEGYGFHRR